MAIDIGWFLSISDDADWDEERVARDFLGAILDHGIPVLQDIEGRIAREYSFYLRETPIGQKFIAKVNREQQVSFFSGRPQSSCATCLESIGFDPSDVPYVGVASRGGGVYLTHEQKHLTPERRDGVLRCCGVRVVGTSDLPGLLT